MSRLFEFLLSLACREAYCDIRIRLRKGQVHGQVEVTEQYLEETLPLADTSDPKYQEMVVKTIQGVGSGTP